jgi:NAD(P)-dependent dehydrogenase (short-subunit alcohol dehydrogenase family)
MEISRVPRPGRLEGRTCLIVGGTSGIGLASAQRFLAEGARIVVTGREPQIGHTLREQLAPFGNASAFTLELDDGEGAVARVFECALDTLGGRVDVLLHVAGISGRKFGDGPMHDCSTEGWEYVMRTNAQGAFLTNRAAVRLMLEQTIDTCGLRGSVVNVGSVLDRSPSPAHFGTIAYAASKGAIRSMTLSAAAKYAAHRIRFNLLAPGLIDTPMAARATNDFRIRSYLATKQPLAGGPGSADQVAEAALYLCEPASRFVTGAELVVDGGWSVSEGLQEGEAPSDPEQSP